jgi:regulator of protease activity HflC (stomatin/prohibitin superfamily)
MSFLAIFLGLIVGSILLSVRIIQQNTVYVIEFLGRFRRVMSAGLNFKIPFFEVVAEKVTLRQRNFDLHNKYPSRDKVIVDVATNLIYAVDPSEEGVKRYVYSLTHRDKSIGAIIENSLRTYIAKETHEGILEKKEELAAHIKSDLDKQFCEWGMLISSFQITEVSFPEAITKAMSEVVASQQLMKAAANKGEATKIQTVKEAEAEKERKRLQGEGMALEREAIAQGLRQSIEIMQQATGKQSDEILALLTLTQYTDALKSIGTTENTKVLFIDSNPSKPHELMKAMVQAFEGSKPQS